MAEVDKFTGDSVVQVDASTGADLQGYISQAFLIRASGAAATAIDLEESDDDITYGNIASDDLLFTDTDGASSEGIPADSKIADGDTGIVVYRGVARYIRGSATGATIDVIRGLPQRRANPDNSIAP